MTAEDRLYYGIAALVVALVVGSLAWAGYVMFLEPKIQAKPAFAATPLPRTEVPTVTVPTFTPRATSTPRPPTVTPILPTRTPRATATANPSPTAKAGVSTEEQAYVSEMNRIRYDYWLSGSKLVELLEKANQYRWLVGDAGWIRQMIGVLSTILVRGEELRALKPPLRYRESHQLFVQMSEHFDRMCLLMEQAIEEVDSEITGRAIDEMGVATDYFNQGKVKFEQESELD